MFHSIQLRRHFPTTMPFGQDVQVETTDPTALPVAWELVRRHLSGVERVVDSRRPGAQVHALAMAGGRPVEVSSQLQRQVRIALDAARDTAGLVDPTVGGAVSALRNGRSHGALPLCSSTVIASHRVRGWRTVQLSGTTVQVPAGTSLDLRATAIAVAMDDASNVATQLTGAGVLVRVGSRVATAGPSPDGGWTVDVGGARRQLAGGEGLCVVLDSDCIVNPATGVAPQRLWQRIAVTAPSALLASVTAVQAAVAGATAPRRLSSLPVTAVLDAHDGRRLRLGAPHRQLTVA